MYVYNCDNSYKSESLWLENFIFSPLQLVWILKNVCITSQKRIEQAFWIPTFHVIQENLFFSFFLSLTMDHLKAISLSPGLSFSHKTDLNNKTILHPDDKFHKFSYGYSCISCSLQWITNLSFPKQIPLFVKLVHVRNHALLA